MVDRQDIDALLVGALYGELTPADEARLAAHLESHPTDKSALDDMKSARQAVRESRLFEAQQEPPQAISALLLQEAHRRAPRPARTADDREDGWFARLARTLFAHPAMAAAATLMLVVGVAGSLYMHRGMDDSAIQTASAPAAQQSAAPADQTPPAAAAVPAPAVGGEPSTGSGIAVELSDKLGKDQPAPTNAAPPSAPMAEPEGANVNALSQNQGYGTKGAVDRREAPKHESVYIGAPKPQMPRDLDGASSSAPISKKSRAKAALDEDDNEVAAKPTARAPSTPSKTAPAHAQSKNDPFSDADPSARAAPTPAPVMAAPPPPPPQAPSAAADSAGKRLESKPAAPSGGAGAAPSTTPAQEASVNDWARSSLQKTISLVNDGNCPEAARVANDIRARAPDFYQQNVAYNRKLSACSAYIDGAAAQKAAPARKRAAPAPAAAADSDEAPSKK